MSSLEHVFSPITVGTLRLDHRVVVPPHGGGNGNLLGSDAEFEHLSTRFASASGRDIKGLAKLVAKYCHHKQIPPGPAVFERCAVFRGLDGKD